MIRSAATALLLLLAGCALPSASADPVQIRIANESAHHFDRVLVGFPAQQVDYGPVPPGGQAAYRTVREAYRYAYVEVHLGSETLVLQPIDFVGESLLAPGRYTYALEIGLGSDQLRLTLRQDR